MILWRSSAFKQASETHAKDTSSETHARTQTREKQFETQKARSLSASATYHMGERAGVGRRMKNTRGDQHSLELERGPVQVLVEKT